MYDIVGWEFKNVFYKVLLQNGVPEEVVLDFRRYLLGSNEGRTGLFPKIYELLETKKFNDDIFREFNELISLHQRLLLFCDGLENFFSPVLFLTLSCSTFHLIFIEFVLVTTDDNSLRMSMIMYFYGGLIHSFWPALFGQLLKNQSERLLNDLYELPWYLCDKRLQTNFKFVHLRMSKPFAVTMAKLAEVNLTFYAWMVRTSFSYFTILRQVTDE